jgi:hypothetical protein
MSEEREDNADLTPPQPTKPGRKLAFVPGRPFKKGEPRPPNAGRKKGTPNKVTIAMRDAVIQAMEIAGRKRKDPATGKYIKPGPGGMLGYLTHLALHNEQVFGPMALRVLPMHVNAAVQNSRYKTEEEIRALCLARGISYDVMLEAAEPAGDMIDVTPDRETLKK